MKTFETETMYNKETGEWEESYFIDSCEVEVEEYIETMANEEIEDEYCEEDFDDEDDISEIVKEYIDRLDNCCGSDECLGEIIVDLYNLAFEDGMNTAKLDMIDSISDSFED